MNDFKEHNLENIKSIIQHYFDKKEKKLQKLKTKTNKDKKGHKHSGKKKH